MSRPLPEALASADRRVIERQLKLEADSGRFNPVRNRAFYLLMWHAALRLNEDLSLRLGQVIDIEPRGKRWTVRSSSHVDKHQAKGGKHRNGGEWSSAGPFVLTRSVQRAIRAYVRCALKEGAIKLDPQQPLWVKRRNGAPVRERALQYQWAGLLARAGASKHYHLHQLRHDAMTRFADACGGDVFKVAAYGRCDPYTAQRYVHASPRKLGELAERAASSR